MRAYFLWAVMAMSSIAIGDAQYVCNNGHPCNNGGTCTGTAQKFCVCTSQFTGPYCDVCAVGWTGTNCATDIDECAASPGPCDTNAACANTDGSYTCTCNNGWTGNGVSCTDVDECTTNMDNCDTNAACANTDGSFTCTCNDGWTGNGISCTDVDECDMSTDNCDTNAACTNTDGSFTCTCNDGWTGDGTSCTDVDECTMNTDNCDTNAACTNTDGSFTCICNDGWTGNGVSCTDIDECATNMDNCDDNADCTDTDGSFTCMCKSGFRGDGTSCTANSCNDWFMAGDTASGMFMVWPAASSAAFSVYCEHGFGGGWTVIQQRNSGGEDFVEDSAAYAAGFGTISAGGEFWLGNTQVHEMTASGTHALKVEVELTAGSPHYADYSTFSMGDAAANFALGLSGYTGGTAGDALTDHDGVDFSTNAMGGWWFQTCDRSNLNGAYGSAVYGEGVGWYTFTSHVQSLVTTRMMVKNTT